MPRPTLSLIALVAVALAGCGRQARPERQARGLRVLTYNVYVGNADLAATAALIRAIDADVVALQETTPVMADALRRELGGVYPHIEAHAGPLGNGPGILARTAPSGGRYVPSQVGMNGYWIGTFTVDGRPLQLVNAHLHPSDFAGWNPADAITAYNRGERVRLAQLDELRAQLAPDVPTAIIGDLNSLPGSPTLARLAALGWNDGLANTDAALAPTYTLRGLGFHIDHILVPAAVACSAPAVRREGTSDHFPVTATLSWR